MKIRGLKYGAIVVSGILLCTAPITVWAEKAAEAVETSAAESLEEKTEESKVEETKAETKETEAESKADETETKAEETKASEEETKETEEIGDGEVKADDETAETKADEAKTEETAAEEITDDEVATESNAVSALESDVVGTWSVDDEAGMRFEDGGKGALILPKTSYEFTYVVEDDQLILDFESNKVVDCRYTASVAGDVLTLVGGEGTVGGTYELAKN